MKQYSSSLVETPRHFEGLGKLRYRWIKGLVKNKEVLELGSGLGEGAVFLAQAGAKMVVGIDYARQAVNIAKNKHKLRNLEFRLMNVMELNKWKRKFDVVIAFELLEHLDQQEQQELVRLIRRILKPAGMVVMSTPNRLVFSRGRKRSRYPFHKHELTVDELKQLFSKYFRRVEITGIKCVNQQHLQQRQRLESSLGHRLIDWLTGFGWIHRGIFPELKEGDYRLTEKNIGLCEDLWLEVRV